MLYEIKEPLEHDDIIRHLSIYDKYGVIYGSFVTWHEDEHQEPTELQKILGIPFNDSIINYGIELTRVPPNLVLKLNDKGRAQIIKTWSHITKRVPVFKPCNF